MKAFSLNLLAIAASLSFYSPLAQAADPYGEPTTIHIGGDGRWDYASVDPDAHRLYVTRSTHTQAIDVNTGKVVLDVKGQQRSHGVAPVDSVGRGYITDGRAGTIVAFDLKSGDVLASIAAADDADGEIYDAGTNQILATCGDAGVMAIVDAGADPKTAKVKTVDLGGKPEFLAADGKGMAYANLEDKNQVAVVDLKSLKATDHWSLGSGNDACAFDPGTGYAFASCGDATLTVVKETSPGNFEAIQTVTTPRGARTMAVDTATHILYLPTAEFNPAELNPQQSGQRRPTPKPDSFMIAVVKPTSP